MLHRLGWCLLFCLVITLSSAIFASDSKLIETKLAFERYQITAPFKVSLPVIAVDLVNNDQFPADELVLIGEDEQQITWLAVYVFHEKTNRFTLLDKLRLADKYFAFDVSENQQGLYFLAKNEVVSLQYHDQLTTANKRQTGLYLKQKQSVNSIYLLDKASFISRKDFIQDINNDGLDDIILPDFEQMNLWLGRENSHQYFYQSLAISTQAELSRGSVNFKPTDLFFADFNLDGRQDMAWVTKGYINYLTQINTGEFSTLLAILPLAANIDGLNWWQIRGSDGQSLDQSDLSHRVVEQLKDINGDGLVDVIVRYTQSSGVLDRTNDYEFYLGFTNKTGQLEFPKVASTVIQAEGTLTDLQIIDVNNDGKFEVLLSAFELSVSNIIGALLSGGIDQNVLLFALNNDNIYGEDALLSKEVELSFSLTSGQSGEPIVLLTDVNGDKLQDLILSADEDKLTVFLGQNSAKMFNRNASKHQLILPKDGTLFDHHDINHDGKEDFIMRYGRLDDKNMANTVTILMVK